jgi:hypothetical protein
VAERLVAQRLVGLGGAAVARAPFHDAADMALHRQAGADGLARVSDRRDAGEAVERQPEQVENLALLEGDFLAVLANPVIFHRPVVELAGRHSRRVERDQLLHLSANAWHLVSVGVAAKQDHRLHHALELVWLLPAIGLAAQQRIGPVVRCVLAAILIDATLDVERHGRHRRRQQPHAAVERAEAQGLVWRNADSGLGHVAGAQRLFQLRGAGDQDSRSVALKRRAWRRGAGALNVEAKKAHSFAP